MGVHERVGLDVSERAGRRGVGFCGAERDVERVAVFERRDEQPRASRRRPRRERFIDRFAPPRGADARQRGRLAFGVDLAHRRVERDAHVRHASSGFGQLRSYPGVFFLQVADVLDGGVRRELAQGGVGDRGALRVDEVAVRFERLELEGVRRRIRRRPRESRSGSEFA